MFQMELIPTRPILGLKTHGTLYTVTLLCKCPGIFWPGIMVRTCRHYASTVYTREQSTQTLHAD